MVDGFERTDEKTIGTFPSMYTNFFAYSIMSMENGSSLWGLYVWYDMFTWAGFFNWYVDAILIDVAFWYHIVNAYTRSDTGDWTYNTFEGSNFIDMNRLISPEDSIDPYNKEYWINKVDGVDCNGKVGHGNYCFCPS